MTGSPVAWGLACCLVLCLTGDAAAQRDRGVPGYAPLNPLNASRSGLAAVPYHAPHPGWRGALLAEYGSAIELDQHGTASHLLDAELARVLLQVTRDIGGGRFISVQAGAETSHAGFADDWFDRYHDLIRHRHKARDSRPTDEFAYAIQLDDIRIEYPAAGLGLSDVQLGIGQRHGRHAQSVLAVTAPVSTAPSGYRRGVPAVALVSTVRGAAGDRIGAEGSVGIGYTPRTGALRSWQRPVMFSASAGTRVRAVGDHAVYGLLFYHSPVHRNIVLPELRGGELVTEFGIVVAGRGGRAWRFGIVEDTRLSDGGIDLIVKLSVSL